jgi:hypothetical protein
MCSLVSLGIGVAFAPSFIDISRETNLILKPIINTDGTAFIDIEAIIGLAYKTENPSPLTLAVMGLV